MREMTFIADTADDMRQWAERLGRLLAAGDCVALYGGLGVGKTTFTQGLAWGLGVKKAVNSPTFTLVKEYHGRLPLYHMDLYRLDYTSEELGLEEYWEGDGVTVIEWPEVVDPLLPEDRLDIRIGREDGERRTVAVQATGPESVRRLSRWMAAVGQADGESEGV
mgnify:CR=1 FL=1